MSTKPRVFITRTIPQPVLESLKPYCDVHIWDADTPPPRPKLLDELAQADGVMSMLTEQIDKEALDAAPKLRVISNFAVGYDNVDVVAATKRGIPVGNTPGVLSETTADLAFGLLLAAARRIPESRQYVTDGKWETWNPTTLLGTDVYGKTLGIIGLGRIGYAVAKRAQGFGMKILYHGGSNTDFANAVGAKRMSLEKLLQQSDFVSIHVPLNDETQYMIGAEQLAQMKPEAILVNTARGSIVDSDALYEALNTGIIGAAALDVTDPEPIATDDPLLTLPNCLIVPHIGSATRETRQRMGELAAENLLAGLNGERLPHCVNPKVYKKV